jgi:hypothetical protein
MSVDTSEHASLQLGVYVLGGMARAERLRVEQHLRRCAQCRDECEELTEVAAVLAGLSEAEVRSLLGDAPAPAATRPKLTVLPGGRRSRLTRQIKLAAAAAAVLVFGGVGLGAWLVARPQVLAPVAVVGTNASTGASLSVRIEPAPTGNGRQVRAVVVGLKPGTRFQITATTRSGETVVIVRDTAAGGAQTVLGPLTVEPDEITFFTVAQLDGAVVVSVPYRPGN